MSRTSLTCWALWWYSYTRETSGSHHLKKNVHLSSLLSPWWTALVSLRESFSSYPEEPLTYNVFVYWLFKKKKKGRRRRSYKHLQDFLTLYSQQIGFCVTVLLHFLKIWAVMKRFLCCDLLENTRCLFFFLLFVCLLFKLQNTIVRRWDIFKCEIQWSRSTM